MLSGTENSTMFPFLGTDPGEIIAQIIDYFHPRGRGKQHTLMSCFHLSGGIIAPDCITGMDNNTTLASLPYLPTLIKAMVTIPVISDHDAIVADCDIKPAFCKKKPRTVFLFSKANWCQMKEVMMKFTSSFLTTYLDNTVENNNWSSFKEHITMLMSTHIPSKTTSKRQNLPWISGQQRRKCRRKHRMYKKAKCSNDPDARSNFKLYKKTTAKEQKRARWQYINNIIQKGFEENNTRPFWKSVKAQRQDNFGIPPLKHNGKLHTDSKTKAWIMLDEFSSVFAREDTSFIPQLHSLSHFSHEGVSKLLSSLDEEEEENFA